MQKNKLITLSNKMCSELLTMLDAEEEATKEQIINYLRESIQIITTIDNDDLSNEATTQTLFNNVYKEIAKKSISSYSDTNVNIEKLTLLQEEILHNYDDELIDLHSLTNRFSEIQNHMSHEITKANEIISHLSSQVKDLEKKSNVDALTRVLNRRALSTYLSNLCVNKKLPYSFHVLLIDLDDFKKVNDTYGHIAGDKVLIFIANIFKKALRDGDKIFRYGGEEFLIILNRLSDSQCKEVTNRLVNLIRRNKLIYKGNSLNVTISIGTTKYLEGDSPNSIISRADKALYQAKSNGKNQFYTEET